MDEFKQLYKAAATTRSHIIPGAMAPSKPESQEPAVAMDSEPEPPRLTVDGITMGQQLRWLFYRLGDDEFGLVSITPEHGCVFSYKPALFPSDLEHRPDVVECFHDTLTLQNRVIKINRADDDDTPYNELKEAVVRFLRATGFRFRETQLLEGSGIYSSSSKNGTRCASCSAMVAAIKSSAA